MYCAMPASCLCCIATVRQDIAAVRQLPARQIRLAARQLPGAKLALLSAKSWNAVA
jgi:hypothetical protein